MIVFGFSWFIVLMTFGCSPARGGSTISVISSVWSASAFASAQMAKVFVSLFATMFCCAQVMFCLLLSIMMVLSNRSARQIPNVPAPPYRSTRVLRTSNCELPMASSFTCSIIFSAILVLFWKNAWLW